MKSRFVVVTLIFWCLGLVCPSAENPYNLYGNVDIDMPLELQEPRLMMLKPHLTFCSGGRRFASMLPQHWIFPLIDSQAIRVDQKGLFVLSPDGRVIALLYNEESGIITHPERAWGGSVVDNKISIVSSDDSVKYLFVDGRISAATVQGENFRWDRNGEEVFIRIGEGGDGLKIAEKKTGPIKTLNLVSRESKAVIEFIDTSLSSTAAGNDLERGITRIASGGSEARVDQGFQSLSFRLNGERNVFEWDENGYIARHNDILYSVDDQSGELKTPTISQIIDGREKILVKGTKFEDGILRKFSNQVGIESEYWGIVANGGVLVRKVTKRDHEGAFEVELYRGSFDDRGRLLRDNAGGWTRRYESGRYNVYLDGKLVRSY